MRFGLKGPSAKLHTRIRWNGIRSLSRAYRRPHPPLSPAYCTCAQRDELKFDRLDHETLDLSLFSPYRNSIIRLRRQPRFRYVREKSVGGHARTYWRYNPCTHSFLRGNPLQGRYPRPKEQGQTGRHVQRLHDIDSRALTEMGSWFFRRCINPRNIYPRDYPLPLLLSLSVKSSSALSPIHRRTQSQSKRYMRS